MLSQNGTHIENLVSLDYQQLDDHLVIKAIILQNDG